LSPAVVSRLARQIRDLVKSAPDGVRFVAEEGSLAEIHADIVGPGACR
jgi:hypothetical protein